MKIRYGTVAGLIAVLVLFAAVVSAQPASQNDPSMSGSSNQQNQQAAAATNDSQTVMQVQQALSDKGYFQGTANGKWDSKTQSALQQFQQAQGMQPSGQLDQQTLASLGIQSGSGAGGQSDMSSSSTQSGYGSSGAGGMSNPSNPQSTTNGGQTNSKY